MNTLNSSNISHLKYRSDIDGLRAIAILSVIAFHVSGSFSSGFIGVDIFFVISGYLISTILFKSFQKNTFSYKEYYSRRILRIFPALSLVLFVSLAIGYFLLLADEYKQLGKHVFGGSSFMSNLFLWAEAGYFDSAADTKPLLHLWSLGIEAQFYIFWPLLLGLAWKRKFNFIAITIGVAIASLSISVLTVTTDSTAAFYSPLSRSWELMVGSILSYLCLYQPNFLAKGKDWQSVLGVVLIGLAFFVINKDRAFPGFWALLPTMGTFFIISAGPGTWFNYSILSNRILVWIGLISYPLYLWHWPLISLSHIYFTGTPPKQVRVVVILVAFLLSWLTFLLEKAVRRTEKTSIVISLCLFIIVIGLVGGTIFKLNGFPDRFNSKTNFLGSNLIEWHFWKNDYCLNRYSDRKQKGGWGTCIISKNQSPTLLLLGNSFANHLYPGATKNENLKFHSILSIGSCDPSIGLVLPKDNPCYSRQRDEETFLTNLINSNSSLKFALISTNIWPDLDSDEDKTHKYIAALEKRLVQLDDRGIIPIIFLPKPTLGYDIRTCFSRPFKQATQSCIVHRERKENTKIYELKSKHPKLGFFSPYDTFCDELECRFIQNNSPLLRDLAEHLSEYGSEKLMANFVIWSKKNMPEIIDPKFLSGSDTTSYHF
jgi:peptidoglycan/LPS O-acetylase OafA/YrhL